MSQNTMKETSFLNGMTVAELKQLVGGWPETDEYGEPCKVWVCNSKGLSNQVKWAVPLNLRQSQDCKKEWADLLLEHWG